MSFLAGTCCAAYDICEEASVRPTKVLYFNISQARPKILYFNIFQARPKILYFNIFHNADPARYSKMVKYKVAARNLQNGKVQIPFALLQSDGMPSHALQHSAARRTRIYLAFVRTKNRFSHMCLSLPMTHKLASQLMPSVAKLRS